MDQTLEEADTETDKRNQAAELKQRIAHDSLADISDPVDRTGKHVANIGDDRSDRHSSSGNLQSFLPSLKINGNTKT